MDNCLKEVELISTGYYLPSEPVDFENIDSYLGELKELPENTQKMLPRLKSIMRKIIKLKAYFASDPEGNIKDNNRTMAVKAIKKALKKGGLEPKDIDCIVLGTPLPDYMTPPTTPFIQEDLGIKRCITFDIHSNCSAATKAFQVAADNIRLGRAKTAVVVYSQVPSRTLRADYYNQKKVLPENLLLRWLLSDSSSALILRGRDKVEKGIKMLGTYNESLGGDLKMAMWLKMGADNISLNDVYEKGIHHFGQDYDMVNRVGPQLMAEGVSRMLSQLNIKPKDVDHLIITVPTQKLEDSCKKVIQEKVGISADKWRSNVEQKGYCGGGSVTNTLDELIENKTFKPGDTLIGFVTESSKWMVGGFALKYL